MDEDFIPSNFLSNLFGKIKMSVFKVTENVVDAVTVPDNYVIISDLKSREDV